MTSQIRDTLSIDGQIYAIERSGDRSHLFDPRAEGMSLAPIGSVSSGCIRCFYCKYAIIDRRLLLMELNLYPTHADYLRFKYGRIQALFCGKSPYSNRMWQYRNVELPIEFTGGLVVYSGYIRSDELNISPSMNRPMFLSETIYEAIFETGNLIEFVDRSVRVREVRERVIQEYADETSKIDFSFDKIDKQILQEHFKCQY